MIYLPGLALSLAAFWFALSGLVDPLFLGFAAVSVVATVSLCARLRLIDRDASPWARAPQLALYAVWLAIEVVKSSVSVMLAVLSPSRINPGLVRFRSGARTDLGATVFANSITLTPGTLTIATKGGDVLVHALVEGRAQPDSFATMDRLAARAADGKVR